MEKRRYKSGHGSGNSDVVRTRIVENVFEGLTKGGCVALVAERGLGKHSVAAAIAARARSLSHEVCVLAFAYRSLESGYRRLRACCNTLLDRAQSTPSLLIIEDLAGLDEAYAARVACVIESMAVGGVKVLLVLEPEAEMLVDGLASCLILRSRDLLVTEDEALAWSEFFSGRTFAQVTELTHNIPLLITSLRGTKHSLRGYPDGPAWSQAMEELMGQATGPWLIEEEARLRCAMLALGSGSLDEIEQLNIRVSEDILAQLEADAPLFGVSARDARFECVPCSPELVGRVLVVACRRWPWVIARAVEALAGRGEAYRAGVIALTCSELVSPERLVMRYPVELIDAGLSSLVARFASRALASGDVALQRACDALSLVGAMPRERGSVGLVGDAEASAASMRGASSRVACRDITGLHVALLRACLEVGREPVARRDELPTRILVLSDAARSSGDRVAQVLACFARAQALWLSGSALGAFRELLLFRELREANQHEPSVFLALLRCVFEAMRRLVGDVESPADCMALKQAQCLLDASAPEAMRERASAVLAMSEFMAQPGQTPCDLSRLLIRCSASGEVSLLAVAHLVSALADVDAQVYRRAFVHVKEAIRCADESGAADIRAVAEMVGRLVAAGLGESHVALVPAKESISRDGGSPLNSVSASSIQAAVGRAVSGDVEALVELHCALSGGAKDKVDVATTRLRAMIPRSEVALLAALMCHLDHAAGPALLARLPPEWHAKTPASRYASLIKAAQTIPPALPEPDAGVRAEVSSVSPPPLRVGVLGGLLVTIGGTPLPESAWHRRHARSLLAMLALSPGHVTTRFEAAECFWPDADYARCREGMYTVLSSLRGTLGQVGAAGYVRGELGRLWLDPQSVTCDIDEFDELMRTIMARSVDDEELVALCLRAEGVYQGGTLQMPPDARGMFRRRHAETARRYVDALLVGSAASLRLGDARQAAWLAESASAEAPERNDVASSLKLALEAGGRELGGDINDQQPGGGEGQEAA